MTISQTLRAKVDWIAHEFGMAQTLGALAEWADRQSDCCDHLVRKGRLQRRAEALRLLAAAWKHEDSQADAEAR